MRNKDKADYQGKRQQNTRATQYKKVPEVTDCTRCFTADGLHNTCHSCHTCRCGNKLEEHDDEQLSEIRQSALTGIMLQVAVYHKADAGIECLVGSLRAITVRIQRQPPLTDQQHHSPNKPERIQYQQCLEELLPVHFFIGINPHCLKYQSLYRFHKVRPCLLSFINLCNILSQWIRNHHQQENL